MKRIFRNVLSFTASLILAMSTQVYAQNSITPDVYKDVPFKMEQVKQPSFPNYEVNIKDFGAKGDGVTLNTEAINKAIKQVNQKGGGKVIIPAGLWLTGPIVLLSNVNLYTEMNALVLFTADHTQYDIIKTSFEGLETRRCQSPISAFDQTNIAITGFGTFDGNGDTWRPVKKGKMTEGQWNSLLKKGGITNDKGDIWYPSEGAIKGNNACQEFNVPVGINTDAEWASIRDWLRPVLINIVRCETVLVEGVTFRNSPSWCIHPMLCNDITFNKVTVTNPWYAQNGDALDLESCNRALIINSSFDAGDDAICIKSGKNEEGRRRGIPCQNVIVKNNVVLHGHGGFVVGSEMSGGVKNIYVDNCTFLGTDVGLRFKSTRGRGGVVENIYVQNVNMINIPAEAILFDLFYGGKGALELTEEEGNVKKEAIIPPVTEETPAFRNIYIKDINCKGAGRAIFFNGLPEMRIKNVNLTDIVITDAVKGTELSQAEDVKIKNVCVDIIDKSKHNFQMRNVKNIKIGGKTYKEVKDDIYEMNL